MDKETRNELRKTVINCRKILEASIGDELEGNYGIYRNGKITDWTTISHLSEEEMEFRDQLIVYIKHIESSGFDIKDAIEQMTREVSYTHLNRFSAYKMMEVRGLIKESISRGLNSNGFKFYLADHDADEQLWNQGNQYRAYKHFLEWLGGKLSEEIGVLFSPHDPANKLFPKQQALEEILALVNNPELSDIWSSDETIGWIYQYFTPKELRDKARKESQAPRNSYELSFRNQFFTPRYVVEYLADNTLGRTWYEMRKGDTILKEKCQYLVIRPTEIFLKSGEEPPSEIDENDISELDQEELLNVPVYYKHRDKKDPREIKILDPACGSGHFLLYCFDLLEDIYKEAYCDLDIGPKLREDYRSMEELHKAIPSLIISRNLHGVDIDQRATQIAALALWLRAQKSYLDDNIASVNRPKITKSNIVVAEPMPGNRDMLDDFISGLHPPVIGQLVKTVFEKMEMAGEAGTLLKIEEDIKTEIGDAKERWLTKPRTVQMDLFGDKVPNSYQANLDFSGITDEDFWNEAESLVIRSLKLYSDRASSQEKLARQLFMDDATHGFAFIEICRNRYDVALMNPPFGEATVGFKEKYKNDFPELLWDIYIPFISRLLEMSDMVGAIISRTLLFNSRLSKYREKILRETEILTLSDFGSGVLDATVDTMAFCLKNKYREGNIFGVFNLISDTNDRKEITLKSLIEKFPTCINEKLFPVRQEDFIQVPQFRFSYPFPHFLIKKLNCNTKLDPHAGDVVKGLITGNDFRFVRCSWEVQNRDIYSKWYYLHKGGEYGPYLQDVHLLLNWKDDGLELKKYAKKKYKSVTRTIKNESFYLKPFIGWSEASSVGFCAKPIGKGVITNDSGPGLFSNTNKIKLLGYLNSTPIKLLLHISQVGERGRYHWLKEIIVNLPYYPKQIDIIPEEKVHNIVNSLTFFQQQDETNVYFTHLFFEGFRSVNEYIKWYSEILKKTENIIIENQEIIDKKCITLLHFEGDIEYLTEKTLSEEEKKPIFLNKYNFNEEQHIQNILSYFLGISFNRWDIRWINSGVSFSIDPFEELPKYPFGMSLDLVKNRKDDIDIYSRTSNGIFVDDPKNELDIITSINDVISKIWNDNNSIEEEICSILNIKDIRNYFQKTGNNGFWANHIKKYSRSKRKSPIYWYLRSRKGNYGVWLYYHRLNRDTYFKILSQFVEPKIKLEEIIFNTMRDQIENEEIMGKELKIVENKIEKQELFIDELIDFKEKILKVAHLNLNPDPDDGVVLNIAPLHELVPWKEAEKYWDDLLAGKYEWSSISKQLKERGLIK